jgi:uncharacterized membrane protein
LIITVSMTAATASMSTFSAGSALASSSFGIGTEAPYPLQWKALSE